MKRIKLIILPIILLTILGIYVFDSANIGQESPNVSLKDDSHLVKKSNNSTPSPAIKTPTKFKDRPDFAKIRDVKEKKKTFFEYMLPMIRQANTSVLAQRESILSIREKFINEKDLDNAEQLLLEELLDTYHVDVENEITMAHITELLSRCDIVPAGLILAQSANESAWGTSRFAVKANNFFGLWCFKKGCGLKPADRDDDALHEVAKFESVSHSVRYYVKTINTNNGYKNLRKIRAELRIENETITGMVLAEGLLRYSERGKAYVKEIQSMIRYNNLSRYSLDTRT